MPRLHDLRGVFVGSAAVAEGAATKKQLALFRRLMHNVYADPALTADHQLYARGAGLILPPHGVLGGRSAACWYGAPFASVLDPVVVLLQPDTTWRGPKGIQVHRSVVAASDVVVVDDVPMTTPLRTAWEVCTLETVTTAVGMLDGMVRAGHLSSAALSSLVVSMRGRWRHSRAKTVIPLVDGRAQSPPESWVRVACVRAGLPAPTPQFVVLADGVFLGKVDLAWPEEKLIVEYEGPHHFERLQIVRDDRRYAAFVAAGWRVIRLSTNDLRDLECVTRRIAAELAAARTAG